MYICIECGLPRNFANLVCYKCRSRGPLRACDDCGVEFRTHAIPPIKCVPCKLKVMPSPRPPVEATMRTCSQCGKNVPPRARSNPCIDCRRAARMRECIKCGKAFEALTEDRAHCSMQCRYIDPLPAFKPCTSCGKPMEVDASSSPEPMCRPCRRLRRETREVPPCEQCGAPAKNCRRFCSRACYAESRRIWASKADRYAAKCRSRRATLRGLSSGRYTPQGIADRDDYRCGICGESVDMTLSSFDRMGPTMDHVIPIARGGHDVAENVQLAHRACNSRKGVRIKANMSPP